MKYQKVVTLIILLLSATFAFTSCNDDGYSLITCFFNRTDF